MHFMLTHLAYFGIFCIFLHINAKRRHTYGATAYLCIFCIFFHIFSYFNLAIIGCLSLCILSMQCIYLHINENEYFACFQNLDLHILYFYSYGFFCIYVHIFCLRILSYLGYYAHIIVIYCRCLTCIFVHISCTFGTHSCTFLIAQLCYLLHI